LTPRQETSIQSTMRRLLGRGPPQLEVRDGLSQNPKHFGVGVHPGRRITGHRLRGGDGVERARPLVLKGSDGQAVVMFKRSADGDEAHHVGGGGRWSLANRTGDGVRAGENEARGDAAGVRSLTSKPSGCRWLRRFFFLGAESVVEAASPSRERASRLACFRRPHIRRHSPCGQLPGGKCSSRVGLPRAAGLRMWRRNEASVKYFVKL
jgi:hypothetical protein